jgi:hypothetical protein
MLIAGQIEVVGLDAAPLPHLVLYPAGIVHPQG